MKPQTLNALYFKRFTKYVKSNLRLSPCGLYATTEIDSCFLTLHVQSQPLRLEADLLVSAARLYNHLDALSKSNLAREPLRLQATNGGQSLHMEAGDYTVTLEAEPAEGKNYPTPPYTPPLLHLRAPYVLDVCQAVSKVINLHDPRHNLALIHFTTRPTHDLIAEATNGYALVQRTLGRSTQPADHLNGIPRRALPLLQSALALAGDEDEDLALSIQHGQVHLTTPHLQASIQCELHYPDSDLIVRPATTTQWIPLSVQETLRKLPLYSQPIAPSLYARPSIPCVRLLVQNGQITLASPPAHENGGKGEGIPFNAQYLQNVLASAPTHHVEAAIGDPTSPSFFRTPTGDWLAVLMPILLR